MKKEEKLLLEISKNFFTNHLHKYEVDDIEWDYLFALSEENKLTTIIIKEFADIVPKKIKKELYAKKNATRKYRDFYINELMKIVKLAEQNNIDYAVIKGIAFSKTIYDDIFIRKLGDIDFVVRENQMDEFFHIANKKGYKHMIDYDPFKIPRINKRLPFDIPLIIYYDNFHEYQLLNIEDKLQVPLEIKRAATGLYNPKAFNEMLNRVKEIQITKSFFIKTLQLEDDFIYNCCNCYSDCELQYDKRKGKLSYWMDIYGFLYKYASILSWESILERSIRYKVLFKVYWVLFNVSILYNTDFTRFLENTITFDKQYIKQEKIFYGMPILDNGGIFSWKDQINQRLFSYEKNVTEMKELLYKNIYVNKTNVENNNKIMGFNFNNEFSFTYQFNFRNHYIVMEIIINKENYEKLNDYRVQFIFHSNIMSDYKQTPITLTRDSDSLQISTIDIDNYNHEFIAYNDLYKIIIEIDLKDINCTKADLDIIYSTMLSKKLLNGYTYKNVYPKMGERNYYLIKYKET